MTATATKIIIAIIATVNIAMSSSLISSVLSVKVAAPFGVVTSLLYRHRYVNRFRKNRCSQGVELALFGVLSGFQAFQRLKRVRTRLKRENA